MTKKGNKNTLKMLFSASSQWSKICFGYQGIIFNGKKGLKFSQIVLVRLEGGDPPPPKRSAWPLFPSFFFWPLPLQRYRNYLSVIYLLKLKVQVITSIHWFTALWLVEMFICQIFLMDYSIWVAKFWGRIYQKLSNNSELKTWQGRKYRILNLPRAFKDTQSSKLLFKVSPPHIILVSSWFVLCPENWVAEHTPTQR